MSRCFGDSIAKKLGILYIPCKIKRNKNKKNLKK